MTLEDDYYQFEIDGKTVARCWALPNKLPWPPPEELNFFGLVWKLDSHSALTDDQSRGMTHVARGALYVPLPGTLQALAQLDTSTATLQ